MQFISEISPVLSNKKGNQVFYLPSCYPVKYLYVYLCTCTTFLLEIIGAIALEKGRVTFPFHDERQVWSAHDLVPIYTPGLKTIKR